MEECLVVSLKSCGLGLRLYFLLMVLVTTKYIYIYIYIYIGGPLVVETPGLLPSLPPLNPALYQN